MGRDTTQFGRHLRAAMEAQGVTIGQLAQAIDAKYESVRRVVIGDTTPSKYLLQGICEMLHFNKAEMKLLVEQDRLKTRLGQEAFAKLSGVKPGVERVNDLWDDLSPQHRTDVVTMVSMFANQDKFSHQRKHKASA